MAFYFNNKLNLEIEGIKFTIDISDKSVNNSIVFIQQKSVELYEKASEESKLEENIKEYFESMKKFLIDVLGEQANVFFDESKLVSYEDLAELTTYVLNEITIFKNNKINNMLSKTN